ncbi:hypothetical protein [Phaeobacter sp. JH20_39]|uniref:hypothetical protein n=1 Tax=Phaeobacter sp. JH20_39 TaxID=3112496 RepID=UPI003A89F104
MATDLKSLKKPKGTPPPRDASVDVISIDPRAETEALRPLQVRIPNSIFEEFSKRAGEDFGYSHGAKKKLFLKMWKAFNAQSMQD